jgi:hypothetical protein
MGIDVWAMKDGQPIEIVWRIANEEYIKDHQLRTAFEEASKRVIEEHGTVDYMLALGGLDCSESISALVRCSGVYYRELYFSAAEIKEFHFISDWTEAPDYLDKALVASAQEFLRVCAENNLGILFT